jgi:hypothetical protein
MFPKVLTEKSVVLSLQKKFLIQFDALSFPLLLSLIRACSLYYGKQIIALSPWKITAVTDKN